MSVAGISSNKYAVLRGVSLRCPVRCGTTSATRQLPILRGRSTGSRSPCAGFLPAMRTSIGFCLL